VISENKLFASWMEAKGNNKEILQDQLLKRLKLYATKVVWKVLREHNPDIVNQACWRAIQHAEGFKGDSKFSTWFYAVVHNLCQSYLRDKKLKAEVSFDDLSAKQVAQLPVEELGERQLMVKRAMQELTEEECEFLDSKMAGVQDDVLAVRYGVSHGAIRVRWYRLKKKLESQLGR
jgi:RNA polymerase sigma factor (sigma-70 family)